MVGDMALRRTEGLREKYASCVLVIAALLACVATVFIAAPGDRVGDLSIVLGVGAVIAGFMVAGAPDGVSLSASFIVYVLAGAFLGVRSAAAAALVSELVAALTLRTRLRSVVFVNVPASVLPAIAAALTSRAVQARPVDSAVFYVGVSLAAVVAFALSFIIFATLRRRFFPSWQQFGVRTFLDHAPGMMINLLLVVAGAAITVKLGNAGIAFALSAVFTFSYMEHLLAESRDRAERYVSLSWGVLAGLMRTLHIRDERAARHAAAVAHFARDIAEAVGMSEREQELAHTAGLLHDIGHFALSDRIAERRGRELTEEDWEAVYRHPELGADMLKDLGMYGPVAEIVLAHHERIDGRGYPSGIVSPEIPEIPEIAKIIAVAEVYDTLTASDTYRTQMSSFEALRELRRVAGTQLDGRYVEVLASLLIGEGVEYRQADDADFDTELAMERRIIEARTG